MSRTKKTPASPKRPQSIASKPRLTPEQEKALDFERQTWTPAMASEWSGIPYRTLYRLLREGLVPCIPIGESQTQKWPKGKTGKRSRACFRFVIPRVSFINWLESIGKPDPETIGTIGTGKPDNLGSAAA
jgi:hypothetical protein